MTDEDKVKAERARLRAQKTPGGVTVDSTGLPHPTALSDDSRAAQVQALKNERELLKGRAEDADDPVAKRRISEIDKALSSFRERPARGSQPETA